MKPLHRNYIDRLTRPVIWGSILIFITALALALLSLLGHEQHSA